MALSYPDQVRDRALGLLRDTKALRTASGLGFFDTERKRSDDAIARLQKGPWTFVDLRDLSAEDAERALLATGDSEVVLAATSSFPVRPIEQWLHAASDKEREVVFDSQKKLVRREDQSVIIVVADREALPGASRELVRIPYWDFIR